MSPTLPTFDDVRQAAERLRGKAIRTALLRHDILDERAGGPVFIKPECLQHVGAFKFRGAYNALAMLDPEVRKHGVVAYSSGNHAQGVAAAARYFGVSATIIMPSDAPSVKIEGVQRLGGIIEFYDRETQNREEMAREIASTRGAPIIPAYDHRDIIAGQGTAGLEICEDLEAMGLKADLFACCVGGGGLVAGSGLAFKAMSPKTEIWAVEPEGFDDYARSLAAGERVKNAKTTGSICDALMSPMPGEMTFALNRHQLTGGVAISDEEAMAAMAFAFHHFKIVLEPGGAAALAAVLAEKLDTANKTTVIMASGGNVDPAIFSKALGFGRPHYDEDED